MEGAWRWIEADLESEADGTGSGLGEFRLVSLCGSIFASLGASLVSPKC